MVIAKTVLIDMIKKGIVKITPLKMDQIGPGSIDLSLGNEFRLYPPDSKSIRVTEGTDFKRYTKKITAEEIIIRPGDFVIGITKEKIKLPENICGWLQGRSRFARLGLTIHMTASFVQPGSENRQVLEMFNLGPHPLAIKAGERIVQLVLERTEGRGKLTGKFKNQVL
ncbi:MAG: dCTP deaminase [Candidatus Nanoarchaeia archaeon]|nr:dCTP deaminase [Candidatus Nanoarchaeia archaeon]